MTYIIMGTAAAAIIIILAYFSDLKKKKRNAPPQKKSEQKDVGVSFVNCPVCGTPLSKGQNLISKVYRPMNVPDQRCTINGCPHCYPVPEPGIRRTCPCCKKEIPLNGFLVSRLFNYADKKKHVVITGCSECCAR